MATNVNFLLLQQPLSHEHLRVKTSQRIYKTRWASLSLYEEVGKLKNCLDLPEIGPESMDSVEHTAKCVESPTIRHSDMCRKVGLATDEQTQYCGMIGVYLNKQIQVNDSCQVNKPQVTVLLFDRL
jgi:hypothetical protein